MKIICTAILFVLCFCIKTNGQCVSGDCENGTGTANFASGIYIGQFKNGLPNGDGVLTGLVVRYLYLDSVRDEGHFSSGLFLNGKRTVLKTWEKANSNPTGNYDGYKLFGIYYYNPYTVYNSHEYAYEYPAEDYMTETNNGKKKKITLYKFNDQVFGDLMWKGKLKQGLPDGDGKLYIGSNSDNVLSVSYDKGLANGNINVDTWYTMSQGGAEGFRLQNFTAINDSVNDLVYVSMISGDTIIQQDKRPFLTAVATNYSQSISGNCTKLVKDGSRKYTGLLNAGRMEGYGEMTYKSGAFFKGFYFHDLRHGPGVLVTASNEKDSGFYLLDKLMKGVVYRKGKEPQAFPICLSGNCNDGFGKASYKTITNDTLKDIYEGNFVNGLPGGYGERLFINGNLTYTKKGIFSAGYLNGEGVIVCNAGVIRKFSGRFENDTLAVGTMFYKDGSSFEFDASYYLHSPYRDMPAVVFGFFNKKQIGGKGTYRSTSGSEISGRFNLNNNGLLLGTYRNKAGIVFDNFGYENNIYAGYGLSSVNYGVDYLDGYVNDIIAKINWDNEQRIKEEKLFELKVERDKKFAKNMENPANFINESGWVNCSACGGNGVFSYSNTYGGNFTREESDGKGGWQNVTYLQTGRTYTTKVKCSACNGARRIFVANKKYIGPAY